MIVVLESTTPILTITSEFYKIISTPCLKFYDANETLFTDLSKITQLGFYRLACCKIIEDSARSGKLKSYASMDHRVYL